MSRELEAAVTPLEKGLLSTSGTFMYLWLFLLISHLFRVFLIILVYTGLM